MRCSASFAIRVVAVALTVGACARRGETGGATEAQLRPGRAPRLSYEPPPGADDVTPAGTDAVDASPAANRRPPCPAEMVLVEGAYCTEVRELCKRWEDAPTSKLARCAEFAPSVCLGGRVHVRFCIDRDEYVAAGERLPMGATSWSQARNVCMRGDKRLCMETEWEFACEGEQMFPYPTGYARDPQACNYDRGELVDSQTRALRDQRRTPAELDRCVSPFGVRAMSGNVDEWVWRNRSPGAWRSALKGGWWMAGRDRCRPATTAHREDFRELQTGVRCCADAK